MIQQHHFNPPPSASADKKVRSRRNGIASGGSPTRRRHPRNSHPIFNKQLTNIFEIAHR